MTCIFITKVISKGVEIDHGIYIVDCNKFDSGSFSPNDKYLCL